jgi:hypothetical protein
MRCVPTHSTLGLYAAPTGIDTTALPALPHTNSASRNRFVVIRYICGHRNSFDAAQRATPAHLTWTEGSACGFPRKRLLGNLVNSGETPSDGRELFHSAIVSTGMMIGGRRRIHGKGAWEDGG